MKQTINEMNARIVDFFGLPKNTSKAVVTLEAGKPTMIEVTCRVHGPIGSDTLRTETLQFDLVPRHDNTSPIRKMELTEPVKADAGDVRHRDIPEFTYDALRSSDAAVQIQCAKHFRMSFRWPFPKPPICGSIEHFFGVPCRVLSVTCRGTMTVELRTQESELAILDGYAATSKRMTLLNQPPDDKIIARLSDDEYIVHSNADASPGDIISAYHNNAPREYVPMTVRDSVFRPEIGVYEMHCKAVS